MHDLKFGSALFSLKHFDGSSASEFLKPASIAFHGQMARVWDLIIFPALLVEWSGKQALAQAVANLHIFKRPILTPADLSKKGLLNQTAPLVADYLDKMDKSDDDLKLINFRHAAARMSHLLNRYSPEWTQIESILITAVISTYTAVEVFLKDLWIAALNRGTTLAEWIYSREEEKADDAEKPKQSKPPPVQDRSLKISMLLDHGFNLVGKMGDVLAERGETSCKFDSITETLDSYRYAFRAGNNWLFAGSELLYNNLILLDAARNVLVHSSGKIDRGYIQKVKEITAPAFPHLLKLRKGQQFLVTGDFLKHHAEAAQKLCMKMLQFVDLRIKTLEAKGYGGGGTTKPSGA